MCTNFLHAYNILHVTPERYLYSYMQLGCFLGRARGFVDGSVHIHRHGEDGSVNRTGLRQELVLQARTDLIQPHERVHGLVGVYCFTVQY